MAKRWTGMIGTLGDLAFADRDAPAPAEHLPSGRELRRYMVVSILAVLPAAALAVFYLQVRILAVAAAAFVAGRLVELAMARFRGKPTRGGALTVSVLLALTLPADVPLWLVPVGSAFGVFFGKEVFGGTGHNVFNPVLIAKAFLVVSFPTVATGESFDAMGTETVKQLFGLSLPAAESCALAIILAGVVLSATRAVDWQTVGAVVVSAIGGALILRGLGVGEIPEIYTFLLSGGFLFGACILAGDPATSAGTKVGGCFYGLLVGLLAAVICGFTANTEFMMYAVLLGNVAAPTLDAAVLAVDNHRGRA